MNILKRVIISIIILIITIWVWMFLYKKHNLFHQENKIQIIKEYWAWWGNF